MDMNIFEPTLNQKTTVSLSVQIAKLIEKAFDEKTPRVKQVIAENTLKDWAKWIKIKAAKGEL